MRLLIAQLTTAVVLLLALSNLSYANEMDRFIGEYIGHTINHENGRDVQRDLSVSIKEEGDGFRIEWKTTKIKASGNTSSKSYSIDFEPSHRDGIFSSAMKANLFGGRQPLDPMKGDPYVWSQVHGDLLIVHAMIITEEGGYEMLTYKRTLVDGGLDLEFIRIRDGQTLKTIMAHLEKVD